MIIYKYSYLKDEFEDQQRTSPLLRVVFIEVSAFVWSRFKKDLVATCFWRTPEQQREEYKAEIEKDPRFIVPDSPHYVNPQCRAGDISIYLSKLLEPELPILRGFIESNFVRNDEYPVIKIHKTLTGIIHVHFQVPKILKNVVWI